MLAAGSKNLAAFLLALSQNNKKLYGKATWPGCFKWAGNSRPFTSKRATWRTSGPTPRKNVLFSVIKDTRSTSGIVDLVTNVDYVPLVNHYLEQRATRPPPRNRGKKRQKKPPPALGPNTPHHSAGVARQPGRRGVRIRGRRRLLRNHPSSPAWRPAGGVGRDAGARQGPAGQGKNHTKIKMNIF